jgi:hypothetical protein
MSRFAVLGAAVFATALVAVAPASAAHDSSGAFPPGYSFAYNDTYVGWPVAPTAAQHPLRGTLNNPRPAVT